MSVLITKLNQIIEELTKDINQPFGADLGAFNRITDRIIALCQNNLPESDTYVNSIKKLQVEANSTFSFSTSKSIELKNIAQIILDQIEIKIYENNTHSNVDIKQKNLAPETIDTESINNLNVFIVHGHNEAMKASSARVLEKLGLKPIILHEQANQGDTIIEKFTRNSNVNFAIVLLSADDYGYSKLENPNNRKLRARQNVILELGFFYGKLGRNKVVALFEQTDNFEKPSDIDGVIYIPYNSNDNNWQFDLAKELKQAGYQIDVNKLIN